MRINKYLNMGFIDQPGSFFGGGFTITGDVKIEGDIRQNPVRFGLNAESLEDTIAIGQDSEATGEKSQAIGRNAKATRQSSLSLGTESEALGIDATALGVETTAPTNWNTVVGYDAGSFDNGENIVLIGRKSQAQGDDSVAIGESSRANGLQSTSIGKAASALGKNSSIFGQGGTVTGDESTVMGQGASIDNDRVTTLGTSVNVSADDAVAMGTDATVSGKNASAIGKNATAAAQGSTAVGKNTTVTGENSLALGAGTTITQPNTFTFGDRNISLPIGKSFIYPANPGLQSITNIPVNANAVAGSDQGYSFDVAGESVLRIQGKADGAGGINNKRATVLTGFELRGTIDAAPDIISGDIRFKDSDDNDKLIIDTSDNPVQIDFLNNRVQNFGIKTQETITYPEDAGTQTFLDIPVNNATQDSEQSYTFSVGGTSVAKVFGISDGQGGIQSPQFRTTQVLNVNSNNIEDGDSVIYNTSGGFIEQTILENDTVTYESGSGLTGAGDVKLGSSTTINIGAGNFITTNNDNIEVNIGAGIEGDNSDNIRVRGTSISDNFLSEGTSPHKISVNLGTGLEGDGVNNIRVKGDSIAGNVLSEGANPHKVNLNIGDGVIQSGDQIIADSDTFITVNQYGISVNITNGLEGDSNDNIRVSGDSIADGFLSEGQNPHQLSVNLGNGLEDDGSNNIKINPESVAGNGLIEDSLTELGIKEDAIQVSELDTTQNYNFTSSQTFTRTPSSGTADIISLTDGNSDNELLFHLDSSGDFRLRAFDNADSQSLDMLRIDPTVDQLNVESTLNFPNIQGTPSFAAHTHGEAGVTAIPNIGLVNSKITLNTGNGLKNGSSISLGSSNTIDVKPSGIAGTALSDDGSENLQINIGNGIEIDGSDNIRFDAAKVSETYISQGTNPYNLDVNIAAGLEGDGNNNIRVRGDSIADGFLSEGSSAHKLTVNIGSGIEGDGSNNFRVSGDSISDTFLSEGSSPHKLDVNIANGLEGDGFNSIKVNPQDIAGNGLIEDTTTQLGIAEDAIQSGELDTSVSYVFSTLQTIQTDPTSGTGDFLALTNTNTTDELIFNANNNDIFRLQVYDTGSSTIKNLLKFNPDNGIIDVSQTLNFPNLTGSPTFSAHTHGEGGLAQIPNTGIVNSDITITSGNGIKNGGTISLGSSLTLDIEPADFSGALLSDDGSDNLQINVGDGVEADGSDNLRVDGQSVSDTFLSAGQNPHQLDVNISGGLEGDGANSIRVRGDNVADGFLSEGTNPHQLSVNISRGLESDGANNIRINEATKFNFANTIDFASGLTTAGNIEDGTNVIYDSNNTEIKQSILQNDTITLNTSNGISAGSVSLGDSITIGIAGTLKLDSDLESTSGDVIWDDSQSYIPQDRLQNDTVTYTAGNGISSAGSASLGGSNTITVDPSTFISVSSGGISVNIDRGLTGDANDNIQVDESTAFDFSSEITTSSGLNTTGDIRDNTLTIYDFQNSQINQDALQNSTVGVSTGNGLSGGSSSLSLGDSLTLSIPQDAIQTNEIDQSISPTFTGTHTFKGGISMDSQIDMGSNTITNVPIPDSPGEVANKAFVDGVAAGLTIKASSRVATTGPIDLTSSTDPSPIDGVTISNGDRVLIKDQTNAVENGIYDASTATDPTTWVRAFDFDSDDEVESGAFTFIRDGTENGSASYTVVSSDPISVGTDDIEFAEFARAGELSAGTRINLSGQTVSVDVPGLAGSGIEQFSNSLRIDSNSIGDGLTGGSGSNIKVDPTQLTSSQIIADSNNNFKLDTPFNNLTKLVGSPVNVGASLNINNNILANSGTTTIYDSASDHIPIDSLQANSITVNTNNGLSAGSVTLGNSLSIGISGDLTLDSNLKSIDGEVIWDEANSYIPQSRLENTSITLNGGTGLKSGSTASLGGSFSLEVEPNGFAGSGLEDDGSDNLQLVNNSITLSAGNGLKNGSTVKLGNSVSLDVEPDDFAGQFIQDSGSDALEVLISNGLKNDGNGNIRVSGSSLADSFVSAGTNPHQLSVNIGNGLEGDGINNIRVRGDDIAGNALVEGANPYKIDVDADSIGDSELINTSVSVIGGTGIKNGGSVSLGGSLTIDVKPSDFAGSGIQDDDTGSLELINDSVTLSTGFGISGGKTIGLGGSTSLSIDLSNGLEGDGASAIRVNAGAVAGNALTENPTTPYLIDVASNSIGSGELVNDSITFTAGNGISSAGTVSLGSSSTINVDPDTFISTSTSGIAVNIGSGLIGDGADNIRINGSAIADSFLSQGTNAHQLAVNIGNGLEGDGLNNIRVRADNIAGNALVEGNNPYELDVDSSSIGSGELVNNSITVTSGNGLKNGGSVSLGDSIELKVEPANFAGSGIEDDGTDNLQLVNDSIGITTGFGISGGKTIGLGGSTTLSLATASGLENDGNGSVRVRADTIAGNALVEGTSPHIIDVKAGSIGSNELANDSITVSTGNGLSGGSTISLGNSSTLSVNASSFISSGTQGVSVNIGNGLTGNGSDSIQVDESTQFDFTSQISFDVGIDTRGDIVDNTDVIYDKSENYVPLSILQASQIQVTGNNGLSGGTVTLGNSVSVGIDGNLSLDSDLVSTGGSTIWDESNNYIPQGRLQNSSVTVNGNSVSLGSSVSVALADLSPLDVSGNSITDNTTTIYDSANSNIPVGTLSSSKVTVSTSDGIQGGGSPTLGGSGIDISLVNDSITLDTSNGITGGTASLGNSISVGISGSLELDSDLKSSSSGTNTVIYDESEGHIRQEVLENTSITIGGNTVSLGGSTDIQVGDLSDFDLSGNKLLDSQGSLTLGGNVEIPNGTLDISDNKLFIGSSQDFSFSRDIDADEFVFRDEINNIDIFRQPKGGPTNFLQGIDAGPITAPEDSFSQIINEPVTSALASGSRVGYSLSLDNQNIIEIDGEANGSGGIQNTSISLNREVNMNDSLFLGGNNIQGSNKQNINFGNTGGIFMDRGDGSGNAIDLLDADSGGATVINVLSGTRFDIASEETTGPRLRVQSGGNVKVPNGNLSVGGGNLNINSGALNVTGGDISLDIGQALRDNNDEKRIELIDDLTGSSVTVMSGSGTTAGFRANTILAGTTDRANAVTATESLDFGILNSTSGGLFNAVRYKASTSIPGTFELTNAELSLNGNVVTSVGGTNAATTGAVRLANNVSISFRNNADGGNVNALTVDTADSISLGSDSNASKIISNVQHKFNAQINLASSNINNVGVLNVSSITSNNSSSAINITDSGFNFTDDIKNFFGSNEDFAQFYDSASDELVIRDETNSVDLIRQPKQGPTKFIQGADIGSIKAPQNSFTQIINSPSTSSSSSGDTIGYSFAVDNVTGLEIRGDSDGSGGINNVKISVNNISDINQGFIDFEVSGTKRAQLDNNGDLKIEGELTEGATL